MSHATVEGAYVFPASFAQRRLCIPSLYAIT